MPPVLLLIAQLLPAGASTPIDTPHLTVRLSTSAPTVAPGGRISLFIDVEPKPKMHVYSPQQKDYIPVSIVLGNGTRFKAHPPKFPKAEKFFFAALKETVFVYSKPFRIVQDVTVPAPGPGGEAPPADAAVTISGTLRYQACDDAICFLPKNVPVTWTVAVKPRAR